MRKHLFPLFLILCLLLCSCKGQELPATESTADTSAATTESTVAPTDAREPSSSVKVDFSAYTPAEGITPLYSRLHPEPIAELESSDSYGSIYPFIGSILYSASDIGYGYEAGMLYGFADARGRIIADPVYTYASLLTDSISGKFSSLWCFEKNHLIKSSDGESYPEYERRTGFATADGSFVSPCIYEALLLSGDRLLAFYPATSEGETKFDIYTSEGKFLKNSDGFSLPDSEANFYADYAYGDGLYVIPSVEIHPEGYTDIKYYYANEEGQTLLGPYAYARPFYNGKAMVFHGSDYYFIDRSGNQVSPSYSFCSDYDLKGNGYSASVDHADGTSTYYILSRDGSVLIESDQYIISMEQEIFTYTSSEGQAVEDRNYLADTVPTTYYYDSQGKLILEHPECSLLSKDLIYYDSAYYKYLCVENLRTGARLELNTKDGYFSKLGNHEDPFVLYTLWTGSDLTHRLFDSQLQEIPIDGDPLKGLYLNTPGSTSIQAVVLEEDASMHVYTGSNTCFGTYPLQKIHFGNLYEDGTAVLTDQACTRIYSEDGELIFRYPLLSTTED